MTQRKNHDNLAKAGKVRGQTPKVYHGCCECKKKKTGRGHKRYLHHIRFVMKMSGQNNISSF
jgi:ribosomal protein S30